MLCKCLALSCGKIRTSEGALSLPSLDNGDRAPRGHIASEKARRQGRLRRYGGHNVAHQAMTGQTIVFSGSSKSRPARPSRRRECIRAPSAAREPQQGSRPKINVVQVTIGVLASTNDRLAQSLFARSVDVAARVYAHTVDMAALHAGGHRSVALLRRGRRACQIAKEALPFGSTFGGGKPELLIFFHRTAGRSSSIEPQAREPPAPDAGSRRRCCCGLARRHRASARDIGP
jgi:hypothetical protein